MLRFRVQDKILAIILGAILPFATLTFVAVERKIYGEAQDKLSTELESARVAFDEIRRVNLDDLNRSARLVSDLPYFKAAVAVYDPGAPAAVQSDQINTIVPIAHSIIQNVGLDFLALADPNGKIVTAICEDDTLPAGTLGRSFDLLVAEAGRTGEASGCLLVRHQIYEIVVLPVTAGGLPLGSLALGRQFNDALAARIRKMTNSEMVILSGRTPIARCCGEEDLNRERDIARYVNTPGYQPPDPATPLSLDLDNERHLTLWTPITDPGGATVGSYVMQRSLDDALAYVQAIRGLMVVIWTAALIAAIILSFVLARQITKPIQALVRASERTASGDFTHEVPARGSDELSTLAESFNQMNFGLRLSHEQLADYNRRLEERQKELEQSHARLFRSKQALEEMNNELRDTQAQLIQAGKMAAFGELGAGIAHELNQPLASVKGFAQLTISRLDAGSPHRRSLDLIVRSVDYMAKIVSGLRNFARQSTFESAPVDVNQVIHQTELFLSAKLKRHRIQPDLHLDPDLPRISGDANQLQQVFTNLLANAADALESCPRPSVRVSTRAIRGGRVVIVRVTDNGPGIPADVRRNIFRSFFTTKEAGKGTGLGLSISRGIVQNHGGRLSVLCASRGGTTFTIILPVERSASRETPGEGTAAQAA